MPRSPELSERVRLHHLSTQSGSQLILLNWQGRELMSRDSGGAGRRGRGRAACLDVLGADRPAFEATAPGAGDPLLVHEPPG